MINSKIYFLNLLINHYSLKYKKVKLINGKNNYFKPNLY